MKEKMVSLLLVCLVVLSIVYCCSSTILSSHATRSVDAALSRPTIVTVKHRRNPKLPYRGPNFDISGDPVEDIKPH